jgi:hypothetical protein
MSEEKEVTGTTVSQVAVSPDGAPKRKVPAKGTPEFKEYQRAAKAAQRKRDRQKIDGTEIKAKEAIEILHR